ncbi:MAG TPA: hypothetical protein VIS07_17305 [Candidatus Binatia bacterium]
MVDELLARGLLGTGDGADRARLDRVGVPESLRQMVEQQLERTGDDERLLLEAASVVGVRFAAPTLAAALERDVVEVEERCAARAAELRERRRRVGRASRST